MPVIPRRSMIHPDDYVIGPPTQSKFGSQLVPHPPNSNLSSDLTSARTQMTAQISTHLHLRSWIHSSNPHQPRSPHELKIHPNMRAQSLTTVGPPANHSCELGGSGDSHRHLVVLLLHLEYFFGEDNERSILKAIAEKRTASKPACLGASYSSKKKTRIYFSSVRQSFGHTKVCVSTVLVHCH